MDARACHGACTTPAYAALPIGRCHAARRWVPHWSFDADVLETLSYGDPDGFAWSVARYGSYAHRGFKRIPEPPSRTDYLHRHGKCMAHRARKCELGIAIQANRRMHLSAKHIEGNV